MLTLSKKHRTNINKARLSKYLIVFAKAPFNGSFYALKTATREGKQKLNSSSKGRSLVV